MNFRIPAERVTNRERALRWEIDPRSIVFGVGRLFVRKHNLIRYRNIAFDTCEDHKRYHAVRGDSYPRTVELTGRGDYIQPSQHEKTSEKRSPRYGSTILLRGLDCEPLTSKRNDG